MNVFWWFSTITWVTIVFKLWVVKHESLSVILMLSVLLMLSLCPRKWCLGIYVILYMLWCWIHSVVTGVKLMGIWQQCVEGRFLGVRSVQKAMRTKECVALGKIREDGSRWREPERSVWGRYVPVQRDRPTSDICFSKIGFLAFIAMVINCTAGIECRSQNMEVVVAAERYLVCMT